MVDVERELYSLIARLLKGRFPVTHDHFLAEQESLAQNNARSIFSSHPTIQKLTRSHDLPIDKFITIISEMRTKDPQTMLPAQTDRFMNDGDALLHNLACKRSKPLRSQIEILGHAAQICCLAADVTSQIVISGADDNDVKIWRLPSGTQIGHLQVHSQPITNVSIHPSNRFFLTSSLDRKIRIFSLPDCNMISNYTSRDSCWLTNFSRTGKYMLIMYKTTFTLRTIDQKTGEILDNSINTRLPSGHSTEALDFSPGDEFLACTTNKASLRVLSLVTGRLLALKGNCVWDSVTFSHHSATLLLLVASSCDFFVLRYSQDAMFDTEIALTVRGSGRFTRAQFTCDDSRIVAGADHLIAVFSTITKDLIATIPENSYYGNGWNVLPHPLVPHLCAVLCKDGRASLWDVARLEHVQALECMTGGHATDALWTIDGQSLIIADLNGRILIFGSGGREANPLRLETKPRVSVTYESHLHAFFHGREPQTHNNPFQTRVYAPQDEPKPQTP
jgi:WD40 repeat protein